MDENKSRVAAPSRASASIAQRSMMSLERQSMMADGRTASRLSRVPRSPEEAATVVAEPGKVRGPASQLLDEMPPILARGMVYLIVVSLGVMLFWATWFKVDVVMEAEGKLRPKEAVVEIQATQSGQVVQMSVKSGQRVTTDTLLYVVAALPFQSNVEKLKQENEQLAGSIKTQEIALNLLRDSLATGREPREDNWRDCPVPELVTIIEDLKASKKRLEEAMVNDADARGDTNMPAGVNTRVTEEFRLKLAQKRDDQAKAQASLTALEAELATATTNAAVAVDLSKTYEGLYGKGIVSKVEYLGQKQTLSSSRSSLANAQAAVLKSKKDIAQITTDLALLRDQAGRALVEAKRGFERSLTTATNKVAQWKGEVDEKTKKILNIRRDLELANRELQRTEVHSPRSGVIDEIKINHVGALVTTGTTVITLVPDQVPLIAEVTLKNKEIGTLKVEQEALVKVDAFPYNEYGFLTGKLKLISADASEKGDDYRAKVELDPGSKLESPDSEHKVVLRPGMTVKVEIKKEQRRVIDFLIKPFKGLKRERPSVNL